MNFKNTYKALNEASDNATSFANPDEICRDHTGLWLGYKKVIGIHIVLSGRNKAVSSVGAWFAEDEQLDREDFVHDFLFKVIDSSKTGELKLVDNGGKKTDIGTVAKKHIVVKSGVKTEYSVLTKDGKKIYDIAIYCRVLDADDPDLYHS